MANCFAYYKTNVYQADQWQPINHVHKVERKRLNEEAKMPRVPNEVHFEAGQTKI